MANSAATRSFQKDEALNAEKCFYNWLTEVIWVDAKGIDAQGEKAIKSIDKKLESIKRSLLEDKRVYWKRLGVLCREIISHMTDESFTNELSRETFRKIVKFNDEEAALFAEEVGWDKYAEIKVAPYRTKAQDEPEPSTKEVEAPTFSWRLPTVTEFFCGMMILWFIGIITECVADAF